MSVSRLRWQPQAKLQVKNVSWTFVCNFALHPWLLCTFSMKVLCGHQKGELPRPAASQEAGFWQYTGDLSPARPHHLPSAHYGSGQPAALWAELLHQRSAYPGLTESWKGGSFALGWHVSEPGVRSETIAFHEYRVSKEALGSFLSCFYLFFLQESCWRAFQCAKSCWFLLALRTTWSAWGFTTQRNAFSVSPSESSCEHKALWRFSSLHLTG